MPNTSIGSTDDLYNKKPEMTIRNKHNEMKHPLTIELNILAATTKTTNINIADNT
jgi:hypothetical protein